jgi:hypothetical protein
MINYYTRPDGAHIKVDTETKTIVNVLNIPTQKTISQISNEDYYNHIGQQISDTYTPIDEATYIAAFEAARTSIVGM